MDRGRLARVAALGAALALLGGGPPAAGAAVGGRVVDAKTGAPVEGAMVTDGVELVRTDAAGRFVLAAARGEVRARAIGYRRSVVPARGDGELAITLAPVRPKALYLSVNGVGSRRLREAALAVIDQTELNAVVIDVKGDAGKMAYASEVPLAREVGSGAGRSIVDPAAFVADLHARGIYAIARIVVFKDLPLVLARPHLAVRNAHGDVWRDREDLAWADPFRDEVWAYNLAIAAEAAGHGFDEVQFDYVRFPDARGLVFSGPATPAGRCGAIEGFLDAARRRLEPYGVFVAADVFGYVCWNLDDTGIGQHVESLARVVDYVSPMLYPSGYQFGIPGYANPVAHPYEIVYQSLARAAARTKLPPIRFRPWLQAFRDYAFDRRPFDADEIRTQIRAADDFGSNGWMLWNARNVYVTDGLRLESPPAAGVP